MGDEPNEIIATSKAVEETAKTAGKAINASSAVSGWLNELIGKPVLNAAGIFTDPIWAYRGINLAKLQRKVMMERKKRGISDPTSLPLNIAMPIIREASGDLSSERVYVRLQTMTCRRDGGVVEKSALAGVLSGFGGAAAQGLRPPTVVGAAASSALAP